MRSRERVSLRSACRPLIDVIGHGVYLIAYKASLASSGNQDEVNGLLAPLQTMVEAAWDHGTGDALDGRDPEPPPDLAA